MIVIFNISIHQFQWIVFSCVLIGSSPVTLNNNIHCPGTGLKMAARFATVSKDEILAVNESAVPTNTKKETKFGLSVFTGR